MSFVNLNIGEKISWQDSCNHGTLKLKLNRGNQRTQFPNPNHSKHFLAACPRHFPKVFAQAALLHPTRAIPSQRVHRHDFAPQCEIECDGVLGNRFVGSGRDVAYCYSVRAAGGEVDLGGVS